ncbi:MAG: D-alanine--D-alanine ligase [Polyangiaceae bacterium]|nr:D-alanine--D-alanine ligase [Polyangiaceae bacterium]
MTVGSLSVAVLAGGPSAEAAVSRVSARAVAEALRAAGHTVHVLEVSEALPSLLASIQIDAVFPALHGRLGEDGCVQGLLEVMGLPYVGSGVLASAVAAYKPFAKGRFAELGVNQAEGVVVNSRMPVGECVELIWKTLGKHVVLKPASGGSAIGVTRMSDEDDGAAFRAALEAAFLIEANVLVERREHGLEVTCGVLEDDAGEPKALPPTQILAKAADWYDFKSRYGTSASEHLCPAPFETAVIAEIQKLAVLAHRAVGARDLSRVDFVVDPGARRVTVLEVNTLPGMTPTSLFPEACAVMGLSFSTLCDKLVRRAAARPRTEAPAVVPMPA